MPSRVPGDGAFKANILDMGGMLKPGGKMVTASGATDGPFVEAKEIVGGFMIVAAESYEQTLQAAKEGPGLMMPGSSIEIREVIWLASPAEAAGTRAVKVTFAFDAGVFRRHARALQG